MDRVEYILKWIKNNRPGKILDIGSAGNEGKLYSLMRKEVKDSLYGIDISFLEEDNFVVGDCRELPFKNRTFQTVLAGEVIEHFSETDDFLGECNRVLKSGGNLIITTPNRKSWSNLIFRASSLAPTHCKLFGIEELKKEVERYFKVEDITTAPHSDIIQKSEKKVLSKFRELVDKFVSPLLKEKIILNAEKGEK